MSVLIWEKKKRSRHHRNILPYQCDLLRAKTWHRVTERYRRAKAGVRTDHSDGGTFYPLSLSFGPLPTRLRAERRPRFAREPTLTSLMLHLFCVFVKRRGRTERSLANANVILARFKVHSIFYKKLINSECLIWNECSAIGDRPGSICMHFNASFPTVLRTEHRLRPHSDECSGMPCRDVPPYQTPGSHCAPVTVAAYTCAYRPQGPGQGGLLIHIYLSFHAAALHSWTEPWTQWAEIPVCFKAWNEHIIVPRRLAVPAVNVRYFHRCCAVFFDFLKLLRSPGKDCPRFRALMTETFESQPYQRFIRTHQVRRATEGDGALNTLNCKQSHNLVNDALLTLSLC